MVHKPAREAAGRRAPLRSKYLNAQYSSSLTWCRGFLSFFSSASSLPFSAAASSLPSLLASFASAAGWGPAGASCSAGCGAAHTTCSQAGQLAGIRHLLKGLGALFHVSCPSDALCSTGSSGQGLRMRRSSPGLQARQPSARRH